MADRLMSHFLRGHCVGGLGRQEREALSWCITRLACGGAPCFNKYVAVFGRQQLRVVMVHRACEYLRGDDKQACSNCCWLPARVASMMIAARIVASTATS